MKDRERLDRNERKNSLAAFLRAIKFRTPRNDQVKIERDFAQLHSRARKSKDSAEDHLWVRSAN